MTEKFIQAGVARQIITPPPGIFLIGYGDRSKGNLGVLDDLTATALFLEDGQTSLALVACDLLCLNEYIVDRIREQVHRQAGPETAVLVLCSHTHSGPIGYADQHSNPANQAYIDLLVERITRAVVEARANRVAARLSWGRGEAEIAVNRRERMPDGQIEIGVNPDGPIDRSVNVVSVQAESGDVLATLVNFACHGTVLGPKNLLVLADWIGAMRRRVEAEVPGKVLFLQGATGDLNPEMGWDDSKGLHLLESQGRAVGDAVLAVYQAGLQPLNAAPLAIEQQEVWLPLEAEAKTAKPPASYRKPALKVAHLPTFLTFLVDPLINQRYPWRSRIEARDGRWSVPLRVCAARIGDLGLVTFGSETFTEIGMRVKALSPAPLTLFASITDGCIGYLFTEKAYAEGGYEVNVVPYLYRFPARLSRESAALAVRAAMVSLRQLYPVDAASESRSGIQ